MTTTISIARGRTVHTPPVAGRACGLSPEELVRRQVEEMLAQRGEEFLRDADYILRKNAESYKRLA